MAKKTRFVIAVVYAVGFFSLFPLDALSQSSTPLLFYKNTGQWESAVLFKAEMSNSTVIVTNSGFYLQSVSSSVTEQDISMTPYPEEITILLVGMTLSENNPNPVITETEVTAPTIYSYYGNTGNQWSLNTPACSEVVLHNIYPNIDLRLYEQDHQFAYDFILNPNSNPSDISMNFTGIQNISLTDTGALLLRTEWGDIFHSTPYAYPISERSTPIESAFQVADNNTVTIRIPDWPLIDQAVVFDPKLYFSTFFGGSGADDFNDIYVDSDGYMYLTGYTASPDFPLEAAIDSSYSDCCPYNIVISKFTPDNSALVFGTYLSGISAEWDRGTGITVDTDGYIYICGSTSSATFPTLNAWDDSFNGSEDAVLVKLAPDGQLLFSTFYGGANYDGFSSLEIDNEGNIIVTGYTNSPDLTLVNPLDDSFNGANDIMLVKFTPDGSTLLYASYLGGSGDDNPTDIHIDADNTIYLCGQSNSTNYPVQNPYQATRNGTSADAVFSKLSADGSTLLASTYFGGLASETARSIFIDSVGQIYISGTTSSATLPLVNPYDNTLDGSSDGYLACFNSTGDTLTYASYFGGSLAETCWDMKSSRNDELVIMMSTNSTDVPMVNAYDASYNGGNTDVLLIRFSPSLNTISYSTYFGGSGGELPHRCDIDSLNNVYFTGSTNSANFPTRFAFDDTKNSTTDAFMAKLATEFLGCCVGVSGNINFDPADQTDISDLLYFVSYMFDNPAGPSPACFEEADIDGSEAIDIADLLYMVDYMFANPAGPAPIACP